MRITHKFGRPDLKFSSDMTRKLEMKLLKLMLKNSKRLIKNDKCELFKVTTFFPLINDIIGLIIEFN